MDQPDGFLNEHLELTRRYFLRMGAAGAVAGLGGFVAGAEPTAPQLAAAIDKLEPYFTPQEQFRDVSRGDPLPHSLPEEKKRAVELTRETWKLEVVSDPQHPATLGKQLTQNHGTALD